MVQPKAWYAGAVLAVAILAASIGRAQTVDNPAPGLLLGQVDFTHDIPNFGGPASLANPIAVAIDASGHLYVADAQNNRVLGWKNASALKNGASADLVIGQPDQFSTDCISPPTYLHPPPTASSLCSPSGLAVDSSGDLYVVDRVNSRVLEYNQPFSSGVVVGQAANMVFGQFGSMTSNAFNNGGLSNDSLSQPIGVGLDASGNLYVTDWNNGRVLEYNTPRSKTSVPGSGDTTADFVFKDKIVQNGFGPTAVALDAAGNVYVSDSNNNVVVEYNTPLMRTSAAGTVDALPDRTIGQHNASDGPCSMQATARNLCGPAGVAVDSAGNLFVADQGNNRILEYDTPVKSTSAPGVYISANKVFGQKSLTASVCSDGNPKPVSGAPDPAPSAHGLCGPQGVALDSAGDLFVADSSDYRVLEYYSPLKATKTKGSGDTNADLALGQIDLVHNTLNFGGPSALYLPDSIATDTSGHLYVSDNFNNRILGWKSAAALISGAPADIVIGQPDFFANQCVASRKGLCLGLPRGGYPASPVAVDVSGNLYVVDYYNNRVLEYDQPFNRGVNAGQPANLVFGQNGSFTTNTCIGEQPFKVNAPPRTLNAHTICGPGGVTVDPSGNLYVADSGDNRVLEFNTPLKTTAVYGSGDTIPDLVFGEPDFSTDSHCTGPGETTAYSLCGPASLATDSAGNLYVADASNCRVLEYNSPPGIPSNTTANLVFGQDSFTSRTCTNYFYSGATATADSLTYGPSAVAVDPAGNVYISDTFNNRVLEYNTPLANPSELNPTPNLVFGQGGSFTSNACAGGGFLSANFFDYGPSPLTAEGLCFPQGLLGRPIGEPLGGGYGQQPRARIRQSRRGGRARVAQVGATHRRCRAARADRDHLAPTDSVSVWTTCSRPDGIEFRRVHRKLGRSRQSFSASSRCHWKISRTLGS